MNLDRQRLEEILTAAADRLDGDWALLGGALVALGFDARRTTADVDLVGLGGTQAERFALMQLAAELGLAVETINSAADFFLTRIPGWRQRLVPFRSGARGRILRPDATLFVQLKLRRLTPQDLDDCKAMLAVEHGDARIIAADLEALGPTPDRDLSARRLALRALIEAPQPPG